MFRLRPGWLVALSAVIVSMSTWLPWLTTGDKGGGWASAVGASGGSLRLPADFGAGQLIVLLSSALLVSGALIGRGLSVRLGSVAAVLLSLLIGFSTVWYYNLNVHPPVSAAYGLYVGATGAIAGLASSVWALAVSLSGEVLPAT